MNNVTPPRKRRTRGQGEGSIYPRKDGLWVAVIDLGWQNGKRNRKYLYGKTRAEVAEELTLVLYAQGRRLPVKIERQTVEQYLKRWLVDVITPNRRYSTARDYTHHVRLHIAPAIGHKQLANFMPQDVQ